MTHFVNEPEIVGRRYGEDVEVSGGDRFIERSFQFVHSSSNHSVSWKRFAAGAMERLEFRHFSPHHESVEITAEEWYTSDKDRTIARTVMMSLDLEEVAALRDMLTTVLENVESMRTDKAANQ